MEPKICPYLGLIDDPDTNKDFPYEGNTCYRAKKPTPVVMSHQSGYCLTNEHTTCPGYIKGWADGFPKSLRAYPPTYERLLRSKWTWAALTMVLLVSAYLFFSRKNNTMWINLESTEVSQFTEPQSASTIQSTSMLTKPAQTASVQTIPSSTGTSVIAGNTTTDDNDSNSATDNTGTSEIMNNMSTSEITDPSTPTLTSSDIETTNQTAPELPYMVEVITNALNIRSEPVYMANGSNIVDTLVKGEVIEVFEEEKGWLRTEKGWIFKYYTNIVE